MQRLSFSRLFGATALAGCCALAAASSALADKTLLLDDFKGIKQTMPGGDVRQYPDPSKWAFVFWPGSEWKTSYGDGTNWFESNGEGQTYVHPFLSKIKGAILPAEQRYDPFSISDEGLHIKAAVLNAQQQEFYQVGGHRRFGSGMLRAKAAYQYGQLRVVAKMPKARGSWPSIWLLPEDRKWPPEIDVAQAMPWGEHTRQLHVGAVPTPEDGVAGSHQWYDIPADPSDGFHEYGLDWDKDTLRFLFDGAVVKEQPTPPSLQNRKMYLLITFAVGGKWVYNELGIEPMDGGDADRLEVGAAAIESDYPAELVIRSIKITQP